MTRLIHEHFGPNEDCGCRDLPPGYAREGRTVLGMGKKIAAVLKQGIANWISWHGGRSDVPRPVVVEWKAPVCPKCNHPHYNMEDSDFCRKEHPDG